MSPVSLGALEHTHLRATKTIVPRRRDSEGREPCTDAAQSSACDRAETSISVRRCKDPELDVAALARD